MKLSRLRLVVQAMDQPAESNAPTLDARGPEDRQRLEDRGYKRCEHCKQLLPLTVSRCRRRRCPAYAPIWARDSMRKIRENLLAYGGLAAMLTITAPGEAAGLVWDRSRCKHPADERCDGRVKGCKVDPQAAANWNERSRGFWSELNRVCKQRADRRVKNLGHDFKGGLLVYEWELQGRGVWHLHFVVGMETDVERVWTFEYVKAMRLLGPKYLFGFVDAKPLASPQPADKAARYIAKYLAKWCEDGTLEVSETVLAAGRTLLTYVSRRLTQRSCCTMRTLRNARVVWAWLNGFIPDPGLDAWDELVAVCLLDHLPVPLRGP